jgi:hypothetical protein
MLTCNLVPRYNKWFMTIEHFSHMLECYADCWNWVQKQSGDAGEDALGGFIIDNAVNRKLQRKYWNRAFFPAMKWPLQILSNQTKTTIPYDSSQQNLTLGGFKEMVCAIPSATPCEKNLGVTP